MVHCCTTDPQLRTGSIPTYLLSTAMERLVTVGTGTVSFLYDLRLSYMRRVIL